MYFFTLNSEQHPPQYGNIMYDRRIVRGNTYAQHTLPAVSNVIHNILIHATHSNFVPQSPKF